MHLSGICSLYNHVKTVFAVRYTGSCPPKPPKPPPAPKLPECCRPVCPEPIKVKTIKVCNPPVQDCEPKCVQICKSLTDFPPNPCKPVLIRGNPKKYKRVFFIIGLPIILLLNYKVFVVGSEHYVKQLPCREYEYMHRRTKRFPWGETGYRSFFHNDKINTLPDECEPVKTDPDEC